MELTTKALSINTFTCPVNRKTKLPVCVVFHQQLLLLLLFQRNYHRHEHSDEAEMTTNYSNKMLSKRLMQWKTITQPDKYKCSLESSNTHVSSPPPGRDYYSWPFRPLLFFSSIFPSGVCTTYCSFWFIVKYIFKLFSLQKYLWLKNPLIVSMYPVSSSSAILLVKKFTNSRHSFYSMKNLIQQSYVYRESSYVYI